MGVMLFGVLSCRPPPNLPDSPPFPRLPILRRCDDWSVVSLVVPEKEFQTLALRVILIMVFLTLLQKGSACPVRWQYLNGGRLEPQARIKKQQTKITEY
ncbi:unnamed protein product [Caenorhabditis brenneri]